MTSRLLSSMHAATLTNTAADAAEIFDTTPPWFRLHKPSRRFAPCRLDFYTPLSSITTLIPQSPIPSRPHSWLPFTNSPCFTLASLHFLSPPLFSLLLRPHLPPPSLPTLPRYAYNMPIQLHYIQLYRLCYP